MRKTIIIGSNHAGIAAANALLDHYPDQDVTMIDKNSNLSYLGCGTALWVGRQIDSSDQLFYATKEEFEAKGATIYLETAVEKIDFYAKKVFCKASDGTTFCKEYDKLILATGSVPIAPKIPGNTLQNIHFLKKFQDGQAVDDLVGLTSVRKVAVIGAGYIGVEIAEAIKRRGKQVLLFDGAPRSLSNYYDPEFTDEMDRNLSGNGIELHFGEIATAYKGSKQVEAIVTNKGEYPVDLVINAIGFLPNNELGKEQLELFENGAYLVDENQQTSDPSVYAVGDCATLYSNALRKTTYIALATNAVRSGIVAGHNVGGTSLASIGVQGSNGISIFGLNMVSTGLSLEAAKKHQLDVLFTDYTDLQKPAFMTSNDSVSIRIVYEKGSRRIIGAQMSSRADISMAIHLFSLAIQKQMTIDELKLLDLFFLPHFNQPYNYITMAALNAE
ncbi:FAD-dependent oxidoreductase [Enterococcus plantarum]|uniref:NADH oxidase n=1 Tax=Enterococcus plantarum TaxID=1077675 RepID=A0A2W3ZH44_9ENTE|nr:FAD-dependent oxidoreductase [Enterococcus plantarum]MBO0466702.1 FAD-dependent oxidoreductase [Enterococcus plantarum]PZL75847.1 NADH oxidase [Enterococcus plantarum]